MGGLQSRLQAIVGIPEVMDVSSCPLPSPEIVTSSPEEQLPSAEIVTSSPEEQLPSAEIVTPSPEEPPSTPPRVAENRTISLLLIPNPVSFTINRTPVAEPLPSVEPMVELTVEPPTTPEMRLEE